MNEPIPDQVFEIGEKVMLAEDRMILKKGTIGTVIDFTSKMKPTSFDTGWRYAVQFEGRRGPSFMRESSLVRAQPKKPKGPECECGNGRNPIGQGHSQWCKMYRREF